MQKSMLMVVVGLALALGCEPSSAPGTGGAGGTGGGPSVVGSSSSSSSSSSGPGGTGGSTASSSSSGGTPPSCGSAELEPFDCTALYPDPHFAFDPAGSNGLVYGPAPGEAPEGAAAGRVDQQDGTVGAVFVGYGSAPPAIIHVAVWQEAVCGIPATLGPSIPWQDVDPASVTMEPNGLFRVPLPAPVQLDPAKGYTWVAAGLTGFDVGLGTLVAIAGPHEPRFAWLGLKDADCDGVTDDALGWEDIRTPSAPGIAADDADLAVGVELAAPAAP